MGSMDNALLLKRKKILFKYRAGDDTSAATFTRASSATYVNSAGVVTTVASNLLRDAHFIAGVRCTLLEGQRTNLCIQSSGFSLWPTDTSGVVITGSVADPAGGTGASNLSDADATNLRRINQDLGTATFAGTTAAVSLYVKKGTVNAAGGTRILFWDVTSAATRGQIVITWSGTVPVVTASGGGTAGTTVAFTNGWYRVSFTSAALTPANHHLVYIEPALTPIETCDINVFGVQVEDATFISSYIATTTATVTRSADVLFFPFLATPQSMTAYVKAIILSTSTATSGVLHIGNAGDTGEVLDVYRSGSQNYRVSHNSNFSGATAAPSLNDTAEFRAFLDADGTAVLGLSLNGGIEALTTVSTVLALAAAWSDTRIYLNSLGSSSVDFIAIQKLVVLNRNQSIGRCQAA